MSQQKAQNCKWNHRAEPARHVTEKGGFVGGAVLAPRLLLPAGGVGRTPVTGDAGTCLPSPTAAEGRTDGQTAQRGTGGGWVLSGERRWDPRAPAPRKDEQNLGGWWGHTPPPTRSSVTTASGHLSAPRSQMVTQFQTRVWKARWAVK